MCNNAQNITGDFMDFAYIIILSFVSLAVLFIITKIMGFRQISEMSFFDYVIGITIGSIARVIPGSSLIPFPAFP